MFKIILLLVKIINKFSKGCCGKKKKEMLLKSINIVLTVGRGTERSFQVLC